VAVATDSRLREVLLMLAATDSVLALDSSAAAATVDALSSMCLALSAVWLESLESPADAESRVLEPRRMFWTI